MSLVPSEPPRSPVYLDRPQPLGILPSLSFWNQPEVWRHARPFMAVLVPLWVITLGVLFSGVLSLWTMALAGGLGSLLLLGMFERLIRRRMRRRALPAGRK